MSDVLTENISSSIAQINGTRQEIVFFYKGVFNFLRKNTLFLYPIIIVIFVQIFYLCSVPIIMRKIFDYALAKKDVHLLIILLTIIGILFVINTAGIIAQSLLVTKISTKLIYYLRIRIFSKTNELPKKHLSKAEETESSRRFLGDISVIDGQPMYALFDSIKQMGLGISAMALLFYLEWRMAILAIVTMRIFLYMVKFFSKRADLILKKKKQDADLLFGMLQETVLLRVAIYLLQLKSIRISRFNKNAELACQSGEKFNLNIRLITDSTLIAANATTVLVLCIGVYWVIENFITLGVLVGFMTLLFALSNSMSSISTLTPMLIKAANAFKEIQKFIQDSSLTQESKRVVPMPSGKQLMGNIHFEQVSFNYLGDSASTKNQLNAINIKIASKQFIGIVGVSGCGKSTLLKLLLGEYPTTLGKITLDGYDIRELDPQFLLSQFGVVTQDTMLFDASIYDNIRLGKLNATEEEIIAAAKLAELHDIIMSFPNGYQENPLGKLSLGQAQRVSIARALVRNPVILCLDEATSALDPITEATVCKSIENFAKDRTTIFSTHRLRSMVNVDCIFVINDGCLMEQGTHEALLKKQGFYYQLWKKQTGITIDSEGRGAHIQPEWLKNISIFSSLNEVELRKFSNEFLLERYITDSVVFNQGDYGDKFYLIAAGTVDILHNGNRVATLSDGDFFGEIALLSDVPRTAKVVSKTDCTFLVLHHQKFKKMFNGLPEAIKESIKAKAAERQQTHKVFKD